MKKKLISMVLIAAGLMLTACDNKQKNDGKPVESDNTENVAAEDQTEEESAPDDIEGIRSIAKEWAGKPIKVDAGKSAAGIEQFAKAFVKTFPLCETNKAMMDYLNAPNDYKNELYGIDCNPSKGFIRSMMLVETTHETNICYWNRKNGHKLVAAYMEAGYENGETGNLPVFYDYDPATDIMTPEPALTDMIEQRMKSHDAYSLVLPQDGKDIVVYGFTTDEENDSADSEELLLKWNGMTFDWVKEEIE